MTALLLAALALPSFAAPKPAKPSREAQRTFEAAVSLFEQADFDRAQQRFSKAIALFPGWKTASAYRAMCRWTMGDLRGAVEDADVGLKLKPNNAESFVARGKARLVTNDADGAVEDFKTAAALDPESAEAHFGLGSALSSKGQPQQALKPLDNAARLNPDFAAALLVRGTVKDKLRDFSGAVKDYTRVLEINPRLGWARFYRGKSLRELKEYKRSLDDLNEFLDLNPDRGDALYLRSNVKFLLNDYAGAVEDLNKVVELDPRKGLAYSNRGQARALLGDKEGALADLKRALELEPAKRDKIQAAIDGLMASNAPPSMTGNASPDAGQDRRLPPAAPSARPDSETGFLGPSPQSREPAENSNTVTIEEKVERSRRGVEPRLRKELEDDLAPKPLPQPARRVPSDNSPPEVGRDRGLPATPRAPAEIDADRQPASNRGAPPAETTNGLDDSVFIR